MDTAQPSNSSVYTQPVSTPQDQSVPPVQTSPAPTAQTPPQPTPTPSQPAQPTPPPVPPQTPHSSVPQTPPPMPPKKSNVLPLVIVGVLVILILGLGVYIFQNMNKTKQMPVTTAVTPTPTIVPTATPTPIDEASTSASPNSTRFYSQELGIMFDHAKFTTSSGTIQKAVMTQVTGNRVYVYVNGTVPTKGQYVDVFSKVSTDDVIKAANKIIQQDPKFDTCSIQVNKDTAYPSTYERGDLICDGPGGGLSYFLADSAHQTKLLFFSIGQYAIESETGNMTKAWQDTTRFLSNTSTVSPMDAN